MKCPVDGTLLQMMERQGVEIDYCPQCRGVWLDRGELDKILERSASHPSQAGYGPQREPYANQGEDERSGPFSRYEEDDEHSRDEYGRKRKRRSFLDDIFDFG